MARFSGVGVPIRTRWGAGLAASVCVVSLVGVSPASAATVPVWPAASEVTAPANANPHSAPGSPTGLQTISCASAGNCVAVGGYAVSGSRLPMVANETAGGWGEASELTLPGNADTSSQVAGLDGLTCTSAGNCVAAGFYWDSNGFNEPMVVTESDGSWGQASELTLPSDAGTSHQSSLLGGVSCWGVGNCLAVGEYENLSYGTVPMAVTETDGVWGQATALPLPGDAKTGSIQYAPLYSVSCTGPGDCVAVGLYSTTAGLAQPIAFTETDGSWGEATPLALPANATPATPNAPAGGAMLTVDCLSTGNCVAGGYYVAPPSYQTMVLTETDGSWGQATELALPSNAQAGQNIGLTGIDCVSAGNCVAVGEYQTARGPEPFAASRSDGFWVPATEMALPPNAAMTGGAMSGVSCISATNCVAVGDYADNSGATQAMVATSVSSLFISPSMPPTAIVGSKYSARLSASGGTGSYTWSVVSGSLPAGLRLAPGGSIEGTPTTSGTRTFGVEISDTGPPAQNARATLSITVNPGPVKTASVRFGNQELTMTSPGQCVAPSGNMLVTFASAKQSAGAKLRFATVAAYLDQGVRREVLKRIGGRRRLMTVYRPNATSWRQPVSLELAVAKLRANTHTLTLAARYVKVIHRRHHRVDVTVVKRLHEVFTVC